MAKVDLKRKLRRLYFPPHDQPVLVDVPEMSFLMVDGRGDPNTSTEYMEAIEALFGVSYTLKFMIKRHEPEDDYTVMPLEGLWWADEGSVFCPENKDDWNWTSLIAQPPAVTPELVARAVADVGAKKHLPALSRIRLESFREGLCAQLLHVGPYSDEWPAIEKLHAFIAEHDYPIRGKHHEIYLSDPHRTAPERTKTILRQPIGL